MKQIVGSMYLLLLTYWVIQEILYFSRTIWNK